MTRQLRRPPCCLQCLPPLALLPSFSSSWLSSLMLGRRVVSVNLKVGDYKMRVNNIIQNYK